MPSKKSKQMDQVYISIAEFREIKGLKGFCQKFMKEMEREFAGRVEHIYSKQLVKRFKTSSGHQRMSLWAFVSKLVANA